MAASTIDRVNDFTPYPNSTMLRRSTESRVCAKSTEPVAKGPTRSQNRPVTEWKPSSECQSVSSASSPIRVMPIGVDQDTGPQGSDAA
jgi:hypothetical protein